MTIDKMGQEQQWILAITTYEFLTHPNDKGTVGLNAAALAQTIEVLKNVKLSKFGGNDLRMRSGQG